MILDINRLNTSGMAIVLINSELDFCNAIKVPTNSQVVSKF